MLDLQPPVLSQDERRAMLRLARESLRHQLDTNQHLAVEDIEAYAIGETGRRIYNLFVSLHIGGQLRGCIGTLAADLPLAGAVARTVVRAGMADARFAPLTPDELPRCEIEISVLSEFVPIHDSDEIKVGLHGLLVEESGLRGLLLPQVALKYGWSAHEFLRQTFVKAGLSIHESLDKATISVFTAAIFSEGEFPELAEC